MANPEHEKILSSGVRAWNQWRRKHPTLRPDLEDINVGVNRSEIGSKPGMNLRNVNFRDANLRFADLMGADLTNADLSGANLTCARLWYACLRGANLTGAILTNAMISDLTGEGADFTGANLRDIVYEKKHPLNPLWGFLELACATGLEDAQFERLQDYISEAFELMHAPGSRKEFEFEALFDVILERIKILRALYTSKDAAPAELIKVVQLISAELIKYLKRHPTALHQIRPRQFEELVAEILASYGWDVQLTPPTKDGGYDIFAISHHRADVRTSWIIECKKYAPENKVGVDIARALYGVKTALGGVANAMLATTSDFTKGAKAFKSSRYDFELKAYADILEWINAYRPNPQGKLYLKDNRLILPGDDDA
jgi:uncharacterized protein YjbI with pentapeptide repeats